MVGTNDTLGFTGVRASNQTILNGEDRQYTQRSFGVVKQPSKSGRNSQNDVILSRDSVRAVLNLNF